MIEKVSGYLLRNDNLEMLVFTHVDYPEAGRQVPEGTVMPGESPEAAMLREFISARLSIVKRTLPPAVYHFSPKGILLITSSYLPEAISRRPGAKLIHYLTPKSLEFP